MRGLRETMRRLPQKPLGDGHTYAALPDGTNIVSMADGNYRLALPVRISGIGETPIGSIADISIGGSAVAALTHKVPPDDS